MDTSISYSDLKTAYFSSDEQYWIRRIHKLANEYPDYVTVTAEPEDNDGVIMAELNPRIIHIKPPRKFNITEKDKARRRQQMLDLVERQRNTRNKTDK